MPNVVRLCVAGPIAEGHGATPLSIIALGLTTLSIMSFCIIALNFRTLSIRTNLQLSA